MTLDVHQAVLEDLDRDEGVRLTPYDDATGKPLLPGDTLVGNITIGAGVNISAGLSADEAHYLKEQRLKRIELEVNREYPWWVKCPDQVQRGLLNMAFNVGIS